MNLWTMAIKEYFILSKDPELEPHHQMQLSVISKTRSKMRDAVTQSFTSQLQSVNGIVNAKADALFFLH